MKDPRGRQRFWFTVRPIEATEERTDPWEVERGIVSMTPLRLNPTDERRLERARASQPLDEALPANTR
ncbi:MAG TPA: hypothetical protein VIB08_08630 [Thermoanaerobaculia bacterium]